MQQSKKAGFTLIELLVVITIIGLLASTVLASLQGARLAARDAKIMSDIKQLQVALALFRNANGDMYPCNWSRPPGDNPQINMMTTGCYNLRQYISPLPTNPHSQWSGNNMDYLYQPTTDRKSYTMLFRMNKNTNWCSVSMGPGFASWNADPADGGGTNYPPCF